MSSTSTSGVQVIVRLRPLNEREKKHGTLPVISASTNERTVTVIKGTGGRQARSHYAFDNVFTAFSTQDEVFQTTLNPVIKDVLKGFESTVFAYGQTGTGKTYTMEGSLEHPDSYGVIPRAAEAIFEELNREDLQYESFQVYCSFMEIYNEDLCDLLVETSSPTNSGARSPKRGSSATQKLEIMEGKNGPFCRGLSEREVMSAPDLLELMMKAQLQRKVGETNMNKQSSRSHCIFTLRVEAKRRLADGALFETRGRLHMVDLAGSECAKTANMEDGGLQQAARERERMNINRSLLTLGRVVKLLKEQSTKSKPGNVRIPYRDSKLTRILQQALGGNSKTVIIATLSPSVTAIEESISTLNYAQAAHGIINKPVSASYLSEATKSSSLLSGMESSTSGPQSLESWQEMEVRLEYMKCQVEEAKAALARKHMQQQDLVDRAEKAEADRTQIEDQLILMQKKASSLEKELEQAEAQKLATEKELGETKLLLDKTTCVLHATQNTETKLSKEATALIEALKESVADGDQLFGMVVSNRNADLERKRAAKQFNSSVADLLFGVKETLKSLSKQGEVYHSKSTDLATAAASKEERFLLDAKAVLQAAVACVDNAVVTLKSNIQEEDGIVPTADSLVKDTTGRVRSASALLEAGETNLLSQFNSARQKLTECGKRLTELESVQKASAEETLLVLQKRVETSQEKLDELVSSTGTALEQARADRKKIRDATKETIELWRQSMINSGDLITNQSTTQRLLVEQAKETTNTEMQRHVTMETQLGNQAVVLQTGHDGSVSTHGAQRELLLNTKTAMEASHSNQTELLSNFVQRLMKDVENLVQSQVSEVIQEVNSGHAAFLDNNASLLENHTNITSSTLDTLQKAASITTDIQQEAKVAKENDKKIISHLGKTAAVFSGIEQAVSSHQTDVATFAAKTTEKLEESDKLESEDTRVRDNLSTSGNACVKFMTDSLLNDTVDRISTQTEAGSSLVTFTRSDVLKTVTSSLNKMEEPRHEMMSTFSRECSGLEDRVKQGLKQIKNSAGVSSRVADELQEKTKAVESEFVGTTAEQRSKDILETKGAFLACGAEHAEFAIEHIGLCEEGSVKAGVAVDSFVKMDLAAFDEVPDAPERVKVCYNEQLSFTPSENEILASAKKLGRASVSNVLQALSPNQEKVKTHRGPAGHKVPTYPHERNEPRSEHLS